jgi:hypothetical protein
LSEAQTETLRIVDQVGQALSALMPKPRDKQQYKSKLAKAKNLDADRETVILDTHHQE